MGTLTAMARNVYDSHMDNPTEFFNELMNPTEAEYHPAQQNYATLDAKAAVASDGEESELEAVAAGATDSASGGKYAPLWNAVKKGSKVAACVLLGLGVGYAALGAPATANASPIYSWELSAPTDNGNGTYNWTATLHNATIDGTADDSGVAFTVPTGDAKDFSFSGGLLGDEWSVVYNDALIFKAATFDSQEYIDPTSLDPLRDTLIINFNSPYNTIIKDTIDVQLDSLESGDNGHYFINNADVPGVPEPATLALMALGSAMMLTRARRRSSK
jgi:hypothetical protein